MWTDSEIIFLKENYGTKTCKEISKILDKTESAVQNKAFTLELKKGFKKLKVNNEFFSIPNNLNSYWAGFIAADGYIRSNVNNVGITLSKKDRSHLEKFKVDSECENEIKDRESLNKAIGNYTYEKTEHSTLEICGVSKWIDDLNTNFNVVKKKSLILQPPQKLSNDQELSFIKGLIDGDGTIGLTENGRIYFSICGTKEILEWIKSKFDIMVPPLEKHLSAVRMRKDRTLNNHAEYKITGFRVLAILKKLRKMKTPELERKWSNIDKALLPTYNDKYKIE